MGATTMYGSEYHGSKHHGSKHRWSSPRPERRPERTGTSVGMHPSAIRPPSVRHPSAIHPPSVRRLSAVRPPSVQIKRLDKPPVHTSFTAFCGPAVIVA